MRKEWQLDGSVERVMLLQWGRNLIVAEGKKNSELAELAKKLQWGRNLIVAEGRDVALPQVPGARFNGAAT